MEYLKDVTVDRCWFGLELLWNYTQDKSGAASAELEQLAAGTLAQFFGVPVFQSQRPVFMERCVKQIEQGKIREKKDWQKVFRFDFRCKGLNVPQAQGLLVSIIMTYPPGLEENHVSSVILWLQKRYDLIELVFSDMVRYQVGVSVFSLFSFLI